eukprot:COSAG02_NODE_35274_length_471_cov_0.801075_1_plen_109_part_00
MLDRSLNAGMDRGQCQNRGKHRNATSNHVHLLSLSICSGEPVHRNLKVRELLARVYNYVRVSVGGSLPCAEERDFQARCQGSEKACVHPTGMILWLIVQGHTRTYAVL